MLGKLNSYVKRIGVFLIVAALLAGMVGCGGGGYNPPPSQNLEIRTWYDLDAVRDNLAGNYTLMNDLNSTTPGYEELASPTANGGKGWQPIGFYNPQAPTTYTDFTGTLDGQGHEIHDLFINRPDEDFVGLFGYVDEGGHIEDIGVVDAYVIGQDGTSGLVGVNWGTVSNSYSSGNVTGRGFVGGLVGSNAGFSTVTNSYSTSNVTGTELVGGLVGLSEGNVSNSYSTGSVTGNLYVGGLVGANDGDVSDSFWDIETSGQATSDGGTGKNTTEMQDIDTFSGAGWNIVVVALNQTNRSYIWNIANNVTYPFLSWQAV